VLDDVIESINDGMITVFPGFYAKRTLASGSVFRVRNERMADFKVRGWSFATGPYSYEAIQAEIAAKQLKVQKEAEALEARSQLEKQRHEVLQSKRKRKAAEIDTALDATTDPVVEVSDSAKKAKTDE
jgi:hypothetical protein